ncbi:FAD binding domain-containing protein [Aestuariivivens marinum]|uniref:FAD binding domain-containing protein n=1 Tax=Aestuariivivens marinum TaxID=2913555 RepID=UPI001F58B5A3|nr:NAD(P)-binding protein [Aestuariivivens marinum]
MNIYLMFCNGLTTLGNIKKTTMKIGIVGGSIAGCSAAILLHKEGHEVTIFERSSKTLVGRGGGIGTTSSLMEQIKTDGLIKDDFALFQINKMPLVGKAPSHEPYGKKAWAIPMNFNVFQWNELWKNLRRNVPNKLYRAGVKIVDAKCLPQGQVELTTSLGNTEHFDLVLFADGYQSLGRKLMFPEKKLKYRGYILWRGLLKESEMDGDCPLKDEILRLSYTGEPGHNVVYFIPDQNGSVKKGQRVFNWAAYIAIPEAELDNVMTDKTGRLRNGTLPPGNLSEANESMLKRFLSQHIPTYYAKVVNKTKDSYIQVIYTLDLDSYYKDNMCLIGDAGMVVQPFTGSGVFKGYNNAKDLIANLKETHTIDDALERWSNQQLKTGKKLLALGEQMEKAFIWEQIDFAKVGKDETKKWWKASVTFPDNFNYERD